jgi:hypothetical protein
MRPCTRRIVSVAAGIKATSLNSDRVEHAPWCRPPAPTALLIHIKPLDTSHRALASSWGFVFGRIIYGSTCSTLCVARSFNVNRDSSRERVSGGGFARGWQRTHLVRQVLNWLRDSSAGWGDYSVPQRCRRDRRDT